MSSKTKVSKQVKVTQGKEAIIFELSSQGLVISHGELYTGGQVAVESTRFTLKPAGIDALLELLMLGKEVKTTKPTTVPPPSDELEGRFTREGDVPKSPDRPAEETPIEGSGLTRSADKVESGMD